ncbi:MAG: DUF4062 domain-containing protein [Hyphomonas sp.]
MEKRYQIFISSTFTDLLDERKAIQQAVLSLDHFPAGMELFPATDDDQWELIKAVIDDSDYYIIVVGGRYGSMNSEGISYTEMEFDYAVDEKKPILAFVHSQPEEIKSGNTDNNDEARERLNVFREKVKNGRHVKFWSSSEQLQSAVLQALVTETKKNPQEGWVRAGQASDPQTLAVLRAELYELRQSGPPKDIDNLVGGEDEIDISLDFQTDWGRESKRIHTVKLSWDNIFRIVGPVLMQESTERKIRSRLEDELLRLPDTVDGQTYPEVVKSEIFNDDFETIKVQLIALGLIQKGQIKRTPSDTSVYWALTEYGVGYLMKLRALKRNQ